MTEHNEKKMGAFLREVSNWDWEQFCRAEHDSQYTSNEAIIFSLIRSCAMQKMDAIRMSLNRLDGKLKTPISIEYPRIYYLFPNATLHTGDIEKNEGYLEPGEEVLAAASDLVPAPEPEVDANDLPSLSLRQTVTKMSDYPRELPERLIAVAQQVQQRLNAKLAMPPNVPKVKSVVAAHLLVMAQSRNMAALNEVFDQIDGKLIETIQILGEDIYITNYSSIAPANAVVNDAGILQAEATDTQTVWAQKLEQLL